MQMLLCVDAFRVIGQYPEHFDTDAVPEYCSPIMNAIRLIVSAAAEEEPVDRVVDKQQYREVLEQLSEFPEHEFETLLSGPQQDAEEFLRALICALSHPQLGNPDAELRTWTAVQRHCSRCGSQGLNEEPEVITSVAIPPELAEQYTQAGEAVPLTELLEAHQRPERLFCDSEQCESEAPDDRSLIVTHRFQQHSHYWAIHLKRFEYQGAGRKVTARVFAPAVLASGNIAFTLRSAILHIGSRMSSGHYRALGMLSCIARRRLLCFHQSLLEFISSHRVSHWTFRL